MSLIDNLSTKPVLLTEYLFYPCSAVGIDNLSRKPALPIGYLFYPCFAVGFNIAIDKAVKASIVRGG